MDCQVGNDGADKLSKGGEIEGPDMKTIAKIIWQINAAKLFVHAAKPALQKKENLYSRDGFACRGCGYWVPGAIKEMNSKPPGLPEGGLFKPSLGVNCNVGR